MWFISNKYQFLFIIVLTVTSDIAKCDAITNTKFNSHIRDYSSVDVNNVTDVKTLQKEESGKYATFTPAGRPIKFKEIPDSALSSTSNGRGFLYHEHEPGYGLNDYEEGLHYPHGHDYHINEGHPELHGPHTYEHDHHNHYDHHEHYDPHHYSGHHHVDHGHYNKHYKQALAAKTVLWPIAGLALLGAAAALVSNPVLLQLGVISGKRRRRDTEEVTGPDFPADTFTKYADKIKKQNDEAKIVQYNEDLRKDTKQDTLEKADAPNENFKRRVLKTVNLNDIKNNLGVRKTRSSGKRRVEPVTHTPTSNLGSHDSNDDDRFIPIPIKLRTPNISE